MALAPNSSQMKVRIDFTGRFSIQFNDTLGMLGSLDQQNSAPRVASKQFNLSPLVLPTVYIYCDGRVTTRRSGRRRGTIASHRWRENCEHLRKASDAGISFNFHLYELSE